MPILLRKMRIKHHLKILIHKLPLNKSNKNKKHKINNDPDMQGRKTIFFLKLLSKEDFERAKKENLFFLCMGDHPKKYCLTLKKAEPSKYKQVHTMQVFPLELSSQYSQVEVSHMDLIHECHLESSMWQTTFGLHDLVRMHWSINSHKVRMLIDDGALHNFLN